MSSPMQIPRATSDASGLYVPIHRRRRLGRSPHPSPVTDAESGASSASPSGFSSPSSSTRSLSPPPSPSSLSTPGVYTPAQLLALAHSPLIKAWSATHVEALKASAPEVVQTRKQRKALAWRARSGQSPSSHTRTRSTLSSQSESEEDRAVSWRRA